MGQVYEERLVLVFLDERDGTVGVAAGDRSLIDRQFNDLFVFHQWRIPMGEGRLLISPKVVR